MPGWLIADAYQLLQFVHEVAWVYHATVSPRTGRSRGHTARHACPCKTIKKLFTQNCQTNIKLFTQNCQTNKVI